MSAFLKLFKSNKYSNTLQMEDNECTHCHDVPHDKLKKCHDCKNRNVCKLCHYNGKVLCKSCDDSYNQWSNKLQDAGIKAEKQTKYGYKNDKHSNLLL